MIGAPPRVAQGLRALALVATLLVTLIIVPAGQVRAQEASGQPYLAPGITESLITEPADKTRYDRLAHELRCLVCQNQTLAESDASLAADLRRQVESMIIDGRSDDQIKGFLVERYGDFVLYRPPVQTNTWLLWFGPFLLLAIGIAVWIGINRRRSRLMAPAGRSANQPASAFGEPAAGERTTATRGTDKRPPSGAGVPTEDVGAGAATAADIERVRKLLDGS